MGENAVECRACGRENRAGRRFCVGCGTSLDAGCPACGAPFAPDERFCGECGTPLPGAATASAAAALPVRPSALAPAPVAERRLVSVLFADLVGFTPFAAERDAEDVRETLSRYFDLATDVIGRYGGTIEKFIGDAVMAVWGVPRAHEDDAERAVRAALDLVDAIRVLGPGIQARAGVLTGEAAVTLGATNQGMVAGDLVNTAARLQSVAIPGTVLVGEPTMRAASKAIAFEPAGEQTLKGKESPVPAHRALRVIAEVGGRNRQEGLEAPFVGRDDELRQLRDLFHASAKDRRLRLVSVLGPAGIGKSRLAWEFLKYIDGLASTVWWHQGRSPAYGSGLAFWALGEMIRGRCGLRESDDEATTRDRVAATVAEHVPDPAERTWIEPALLALLGIGEKGAASEQLFAAWRTFFERLAATAPVVMLFEDLHWADPGTLDFIDHVLDWTRDQPIVLITLARPEILETRPDWGSRTRHFSQLFLEPLSDQVMRELLAGLVPGLPEPAVRAIVGRADGMPLYAVETVRMLIADGKVRRGPAGYEPVGDLSALAVPETLTALIGARLDALDPVDRSLLQDAAVLGQSFTPVALAALADQPAAELDPRLRALVRREILVLEADPRSPERGQYAFVQSLIREVAYNTLAKRDRKAKHLAAARWFESLGSDELAGALARHYLAAWQNAPEGPEADALAGQARLALTAAAQRAAALHSHQQAIDLVQEALSVATDPTDRMALLEIASSSSDSIGRYQEAEAFAREAMGLAEASSDPEAIARTANLTSISLVSQWRMHESLDLLSATLDRVGDAISIVELLTLKRRYASGVRMTGDPRRALQLIDDGLEAAEHASLRFHVALMLGVRGGICCELGRSIEGLALLRLAVGMMEEEGDPSLALMIRNEVAVFSIALDPAAAFRETVVLIEACKRLSRRADLVINVGNAAETAIRTGDWDWVARSAGELLEEDLATSDRLVMLDSLTQIAALRGEDVRHLLEEAARLAAATPDAIHLVRMQDDRRATAAWVQGRYADAAGHWRDFGLWSPLNAPLCLPRAARMSLWLGDAAAAIGDLRAIDAVGTRGPAVDNARLTIQAGIDAAEGRVSEARSGYRTAIAAWHDLGLPWDEALTCLDLVLLLGPDDPDAPAAAARAREVFEKLGAKPFLAKLDAALARSATTAG